MNGERILIVDDDPMSLKLIRALLNGEGYAVRCAKSADEAVTILETFHPRLILMDIQLPGVDGLELTRRLRDDPATRKTSIIALTAYSMKGDDHKARSAGCDGYITKPIDTRTLPSLVREFLMKGGSRDPLPGGDNEDLLSELRNNLLAEGMDKCSMLLSSMEKDFNVDQTRRFSHRWAGIAGTLGYQEITRKARKLEELLNPPVVESRATIRAGIKDLALCFSKAASGKKLEHVWSPEITAFLSDKRLAVIGFERAEAERMTRALEKIHVHTQTFKRVDPGAQVLAVFDALVMKVSTDGPDAWTSPEKLGNNKKPLLLIGPCETLLETTALVDQTADFLTAPWDPEEVILRAYRLLSKAQQHRTPISHAPGVSNRVVIIADDDIAVTQLVSASLQKFQFDCRVASSGAQALEMVKELRPRALVLDVNMPGMDGFDVLMRMRMDAHIKNIPVILLTARSREEDVMRGFGYGAADYMTKPFSPTELAARVSRLVA
jgi:DNA-binding response OmpR family regulator